MRRYIKLNTLNVLHVPRPHFIAPLYLAHQNYNKNYTESSHSDNSTTTDPAIGPSCFIIINSLVFVSTCIKTVKFVSEILIGLIIYLFSDHQTYGTFIVDKRSTSHRNKNKIRVIHKIS